MGEELDEFNTEVHKFQEQIKKYKNTFELFNRLFPKDSTCSSVKGKVLIDKENSQGSEVEFALIVSRFSPNESDLKLEIGVDISPINFFRFRKSGEFELPHPNNVNLDKIIEINSDEILCKVVDAIDLHPSLNDSFVTYTPKNT